MQDPYRMTSFHVAGSKVDGLCQQAIDAGKSNQKDTRPDHPDVSVKGVGHEGQKIWGSSRSSVSSGVAKLSEANLAALEKQFGFVDWSTEKPLVVLDWLSQREKSGMTTQTLKVCEDLLLVMSEPVTVKGRRHSSGGQLAREEQLLSHVGGHFIQLEGGQELESLLNTGGLMEDGVNSAPRRHTM